MTDTRVTRLIRARMLKPGLVFKDSMYPERGECTVLDVEIHPEVSRPTVDNVTAIVVTESGEQAPFQRSGFHMLTEVVQP